MVLNRIAQTTGIEAAAAALDGAGAGAGVPAVDAAVTGAAGGGGLAGAGGGGCGTGGGGAAGEVTLRQARDTATCQGLLVRQACDLAGTQPWCRWKRRCRAAHLSRRPT